MDAAPGEVELGHRTDSRLPERDRGLHRRPTVRVGGIRHSCRVGCSRDGRDLGFGRTGSLDSTATAGKDRLAGRQPYHDSGQGQVPPSHRVLRGGDLQVTCRQTAVREGSVEAEVGDDASLLARGLLDRAIEARLQQRDRRQRAADHQDESRRGEDREKRMPRSES